MVGGMVIVAACVDPPGEAEDSAALDDCQGTDCPGNSPVVATFPFHDLSVDRARVNNQGFHYDKLLIGGLDYTLHVQNGQISGWRGNTSVSGPALAGAQLWIARAGVSYVLRIRSVEQVEMWALLDPLAPPPRIYAYEIDWSEVTRGKPADNWHNICEATVQPGGGAIDPGSLTNVPKYLTFVFEGERINATSKTIYGYDPLWYNLGCAGHALMKMYLMGHVGAAAWMGYGTSIDERQTILKMFAGDYCGTGRAFTIPGMPLRWADHRGWVDFPAGALTLEARWDSSGAACLNAARADVHANDATRALWPNGVRTAILEACPRLMNATCGGGLANFNGYHMITANPP
jgi:hypothetical protein